MGGEGSTRIFDDVQLFGKFSKGCDYVIFRSVNPSLILLLDLMELNRAYVRFEYGTSYVPLWAGIDENIFYLWVYRLSSQAKSSYAGKIKAKEAISKLEAMHSSKSFNFNSVHLSSSHDAVCCFCVDPIKQTVKLKHIVSTKYVS